MTQSAVLPCTSDLLLYFRLILLHDRIDDFVVGHLGVGFVVAASVEVTVFKHTFECAVLAVVLLTRFSSDALAVELDFHAVGN